jgi:hypothetical protein
MKVPTPAPPAGNRLSSRSIDPAAANRNMSKTARCAAIRMSCMSNSSVTMNQPGFGRKLNDNWMNFCQSNCLHKRRSAYTDGPPKAGYKSATPTRPSPKHSCSCDSQQSQSRRFGNGRNRGDLRSGDRCGANYLCIHRSTLPVERVVDQRVV